MGISRMAPAWLVCGALLVACGNSGPDAKTPGDVASVNVPPASSSESPPPDPARADPEPAETAKKPPKQADPPPVPVALEPVVGPTTSSGGSATPVGSASAPIAALQALAATDAPGMAPAGTTLAASFKTGQTLEFQLTLMPGRCYTILATGAPSIQQIELVLGMMVPGLPPVALAQGSGASGASIGGKGSGCFKNPMPMAMPATVTMKVTSGSGIAGAQVYAK
jgi:hypothetical protein